MLLLFALVRLHDRAGVSRLYSMLVEPLEDDFLGCLAPLRILIIIVAHGVKVRKAGLEELRWRVNSLLLAWLERVAPYVANLHGLSYLYF